MIRVQIRDANGIIHDATTGEIPELLKVCARKDNSMMWVDMSDTETMTDTASGKVRSTDAEIARVLTDVFKFHPLAVEDALTETSVPKLDDWGDYLYAALHAVDFSHELSHLQTHELDVFVQRNYIVTHHFDPLPGLERVWKNVMRDERHTRRGSDYVLYELCDAMATEYMPALDAIDDELDELQDSIFKGVPHKGKPPTSHIFTLKRAVLNLRRILAPQREVMNKLARDAHPALDAKDQVYFRDVYDHFVRLADLTESLRDITSGSLDTYLSVTANKTNEVMKTLTLVTVLFAPLSFITGFFGMNFFGGSYEINAPTAPVMLFMLMTLIGVSVPVVILGYARRKGWW